MFPKDMDKKKNTNDLKRFSLINWAEIKTLKLHRG